MWIHILGATQAVTLLLLLQYHMKYRAARKMLGEFNAASGRVAEVTQFVCRAWVARSEAKCIHEARDRFRQLECVDQDKLVENALEEMESIFEGEILDSLDSEDGHGNDEGKIDPHSVN